tara:strand:- start:4516 stop:4866 length:351 start_codon:yes stop_codon:yes gene_type:complete
MKEKCCDDNLLHKMFEKQIILQCKLNDTTKIIGNQNFININCIGLIDEVMEAIRETPWKPWKKNQKYNNENFKEELIDAWHFLINLSIAAGMTSTETFTRFCKKNKINHKRKEMGY